MTPEHGGCNWAVENASLHLCCCCKHGYASALCNSSFSSPVDFHVVVVRHPLSWLWQMYGKTYEIEQPYSNFADFLRGPIQSTRYCYNDNQYTDIQPNPVHLWLRKVQSYVSLPGAKAIFPMTAMLRLNTFRAALEPLNVLMKLGASFEYAPWSDGIDDKGSQQFTSEGTELALKYEEGRQWLDGYTQNDLTYVLDLLREHEQVLQSAGLDFHLEEIRGNASRVSNLGGQTLLAYAAKPKMIRPEDKLIGGRRVGDYLG